MNALFEQKDNWIGADGAYSVALTPERTLWLFSDTWVGHIRAGKRSNAVLINNSIALEDGRGAGAKMEFIVRRGHDGKPTAFVTPRDKHGWFWLQSGACVDDRLYIFLMQLEKTGAGGAFGFRRIGQWLAVVDNPLDPPINWRIEQRSLPCGTFSPDHKVAFGMANVTAGEYLYIYGTDERVRGGYPDRHLIVARVRTNEVADFSAWRYYANGKWETNYHKASWIADGMAPECSVSFLPQWNQYVLIYTDKGLSPKIQARTAVTPWGKWSAAATVYRCPEMGRDKNAFCYAAKAHPSQSVGDELVISYVANSYSFSQVINDASLYWPRFIRVPLQDKK